jgi:hypothetical protein
MWDLGGHQDLHGIWEKYYSEAHAVVFVVDGTDREMLDQARLAYSVFWPAGKKPGAVIFWRFLFSKCYGEAHAVVFVVDAHNLLWLFLCILSLRFLVFIYLVLGLNA